MATARKTAIIYVEVGADKKQVKLEDIQKAVKTVEGTKNAYVNAADAAVYCVDSDGKTTKVEL